MIDVVRAIGDQSIMRESSDEWRSDLGHRLRAGIQLSIATVLSRSSLGAAMKHEGRFRRDVTVALYMAAEMWERGDAGVSGEQDNILRYLLTRRPGVANDNPSEGDLKNIAAEIGAVRLPVLLSAVREVLALMCDFGKLPSTPGGELLHEVVAVNGFGLLSHNVFGSFEFRFNFDA